MNSASNSSRPKARRVWIPLILVLLIVAGGFAYTYWNQKTVVTAQAQATEKSITTKQVRTGSITLAASGSVTLEASKETALAFTVSGTVANLNVVVGDKVTKDQVLAQLGNLDDLEAEIKSAEQDLVSAQTALAAFKAKAPANLANAQLKVIEAEQAVEDAQGSVVQKDWARCSQTTKDSLLTRYNKAVKQLNGLGDGGGNADYYLNTIEPQKKVVDQALGAYQACAGYTDYQVASSQANLSVAQAALKTAQDNLDTLTENDGLDPMQLATTENKVATAQEAVDTANDNLAGATLKAPFDGTVLSVSGKAGDTIEITSRITSVDFITVSDLAHPLLQFTIDQTDMSMVAAGESTLIIFDAFPNRTFKGTVTRLDPAVASSSGGFAGAGESSSGSTSSSVTGLIELDLSQETDVPTFPKSASGSVQIIQADAENVLLIPVEALHQQSDGTYYVYLLNSNGQPVQKSVEIGLQDAASVEIKSGLSATDIVITSTIQ
jgi:HlyD family secretion protein